MSEEPVKYIVFTAVPHDQLDEWNRWHNETHVPDVLATGYMQSARKYRVADNSLPIEWQPQYATVYECASSADLEAYLGGPAAQLRQDYADRYGAVGQIARMILVEDKQF